MAESKGLKEKLISDYRQNKIRNIHHNFQKEFQNYFQKNNYKKIEPHNLIADKDKSVMFTSSSTNPLKELMIYGNFGKYHGGYVTQECLRTHAIKHAFDNSWLPFGQAYFRISGTMSRPNRFEEVLNEFSEFTTNEIGVPKENLLIKSSKKFSSLDKIEKSIDLNVKYDSEKEDFYQWVFGVDNFYGEGLTISMNDKENNNHLDVGNVVRIFDNGGNERAIEFGYGHEFFISKVLGVENPLALSEVFEIFPFEKGLSSKYYGNIEVASRIKKARKFSRANKSVKYYHRKYLKSVREMGKSLNKSRDEIMNEILKFYNHIDPGTKNDFSLEERMIKE